MKRTTLTVLALIAVTSLPAALVYAQDVIPPVYDATGAMLTAIAPQPTALSPDTLTAASLSERLEAQGVPATLGAVPPVYDSTGAMLAALEPGPLEGNMAAVESQTTVADNGPIDPIEQAYIERAVSGAPASAASVTSPDAAAQGITRYVEAHEALNLDSGIPPVYDATGAQQAAVVRSDKADAQDVVPPTVATTRTDPSKYLVIALGLLAAAALIGAWSLSHRTPQRHGPRHV